MLNPFLSFSFLKGKEARTEIMPIVLLRKLGSRNIKSLAQTTCSGGRNQTPGTPLYTCPPHLYMH